jgi:DNA mismatch endonuclease (patch repair protein)
MPDHLTLEQRSRAMKSVKLKDGSLEKIVQRELRAKGVRFRCHVHSLPGCPDIVFPKVRVAVFVDGDFWHGWRLSSWEHKLSKFWRDKLRANRRRDQRNFRRLRSRGWTVIRIWQHQLQRDKRACLNRILRWVKSSSERPVRSDGGVDLILTGKGRRRWCSASGDE